MKSSPDLGTPREVHIVTWRREEKRRGRREIEVTRSRREVIKTGENQLASSHFLRVLHSLDPSELFT